MSRPAPAPARDLLLAPIEPTGAVEQVVRRIGEAIGAGLLAPGERLPGQVELADTLGVARMTLRQALAVLEDAGLLEMRRGRTGGAFVAAGPRPRRVPGRSRADRRGDRGRRRRRRPGGHDPPRRGDARLGPRLGARAAPADARGAALTRVALPRPHDGREAGAEGRQTEP